MRARDFVKTVSNFGRIGTGAQRLRRQQAHTAADWTSGKHFLNHLAIVIDGDVKVLPIKRNLPGGAAQFAWALDAYCFDLRLSLSLSVRPPQRSGYCALSAKVHAGV